MAREDKTIEGSSVTTWTARGMFPVIWFDHSLPRCGKPMNYVGAGSPGAQQVRSESQPERARSPKGELVIRQSEWRIESQK